MEYLEIYYIQEVVQLTGREKIEGAFSKNGTSDIPAVICYEGILVRDHWQELVSVPWWYREVPGIECQTLWRREVIEKIGQDWFKLPLGYSREDRKNISIENRPNGVFRINRKTREKEQLSEPQIGGWSSLKGIESIRPHGLAETREEIDDLIPIISHFDAKEILRDGRADLATQLLREFSKNLYPIYHVGSPLWECYFLWGFEGMMTMIGTRPGLVKHACQRFLSINIREVQKAATLGAAVIWIEDCLTDMISPRTFESLNVPYLRKLVEEIHVNGLKSIYYFCGNPAGKWEHLLSIGADALALEESKKGFALDIEDVVSKVQGRCVVLGNLDAIGILQNGTEEQLRAEISRQIEAGRQNKGRFIMSLGSPVTPDTPVKRVRLYCDLVRKLGSI